MVARRTRAQSLTSRLAATVVAVLLVAGAAVAAFVFGTRPGEMRDFEVYWTAAGRAANAEPLYRTADGHYQFKYFPAFAVLSTPAARMSLDAAKSAWFIASTALLVAVIWLSIAVLPECRRPVWMLVLAMVVVMGKFFGHELVLGQVNLLFAATVLSGLLLLRCRHDLAGAAVLAAAIVIKPYAVVFIPWLAFVRGRLPLAAALSTLLLALLLPALLYGVAGAIELHRAWWMTVTASTAPNLVNADNVSLAALFAKWIGPGGAAAVIAGAAGGALAIAAAWIIARGRGITGREVLDVSLLLILIPLLSPQGWDYVFLIATPAVALLANLDDRLPPAWRWTARLSALTIGLSLFDIMGRRHYAAFMSWSIITVCFVLLVGALAALRSRQAA